MDIIGIKLAAELTGVAENTLRYWRQVEQGPASFKLGRRVMYRRDELERWLAEQESTTSRGGRQAV